MDCDGLIKSDRALIRGVLATDWGWSGLVGTIHPQIDWGLSGAVGGGQGRLGWSTTGRG